MHGITVKVAETLSCLNLCKVVMCHYVTTLPRDIDGSLDASINQQLLDLRT